MLFLQFFYRPFVTAFCSKVTVILTTSVRFETWKSLNLSQWILHLEGS